MSFVIARSIALRVFDLRSSRDKKLNILIYLGFVSHQNVNVNRCEYKTTRQHDGPDLQLCAQRQSARLLNLPNCFLLAVSRARIR